MTTLEILLLIALIFAIICDVIRIVCWVRLGTGKSKANVKQHICTRVRVAEEEWYNNDDILGETFGDYLERKFDKYFG